MPGKFLRFVLAWPLPVAAIGVSAACSLSIVITWHRMKGFCTEAKGDTRINLVRRAEKANLKVVPFNDGVLMVARPALFPIAPFSCEARYMGDRVKTTVFFSD